ncbi:putative cytochrome P450 9f2, partial [Pseudolycoriella hygida]
LLFYTLISGTLFYAFYKWATTNREYFSKRKLKHLEPRFLIGNTVGLFLKRYTPDEFFDYLYHRFPNEKLIGLFDMCDPIYFTRDIDFIRQITIKDFDCFEDHDTFIDGDSDTLFGNSLFLMSENKWRDMRATLSPAFTGSKMRYMFELVVECANNVSNFFVGESKGIQPIRWEMNDLITRYTSDVIASCAFGLKVNSLKDRTNEFYVMGQSSIDFNSGITGLRVLLIRSFTKLMRVIGFELFPANVRKFFKSITMNTIKEREMKRIFRPDMINILMQVRSGNLKQQQDESGNDDAGFATAEESQIGKRQVKRSWTEDEIIAQSFLFFVAGFDTVATIMTFMSYELSIHQGIQQKLFEEIRGVNRNLNGARLSYGDLSKLKYLDQVISEALRKWSPIFTNRKCTKDYECELDGNKFIIERGRTIWIPIYSIHYDSKYFQSPKTFDPERFNDFNKHKIKPGSYMPFGMGPRNCVGSRFALMEMKAFFFYLLLNFNLEPYEKTQIPVKLAKSSAAANWRSENGINLELKPRTQV